MPDQEVKSISEQIIDDLFDRLSKSKVYNETVLTKLKEAAAKGKLISPKTLIEAINTPEE
jgi:hypothetical protein